jgi:hypothetical protein
MILFTLRARAHIENAIVDWGTSEQKSHWLPWSLTHPGLRHGPDDPFDDGSGPFPDEIKEIMLGCLKRRHVYLVDRAKSPIANPDEVYEDRSRADYIKSIASTIYGEKINW